MEWLLLKEWGRHSDHAAGMQFAVTDQAMATFRPIALQDALVGLHEGVFRSPETLAQLMKELAWEQKTIQLFGRQVASPRLTCWAGDPGITYRYSGLTLTATGWPPVLLPIRQKVDALTGAGFNSVLCNLYRNGQDSMGLHSDDEKELGPLIASVSFGATRTFVMQHKTTKERLKIPLAHGSVLTMDGTTQTSWKHAVPKEKKVKGPRVNLTFRQILTG